MAATISEYLMAEAEVKKAEPVNLAVIDCGTNTFNLLVAAVEADGTWQTVFQNKLPVKLGAGGFAQHHITAQRYMRGMDALYCHTQNAANLQCKPVYAFATSAIREAANGKAFVADAKKYFDLDIEIIDGNREAELIYAGITQTTELGNATALVMDIGGGSTEFLIANHKGILWKQSFMLGVSRLHEQLQPADPIVQNDINRLQHVLDETLPTLKEAIGRYAPSVLIGSSGSFDTLLDLYMAGSGNQTKEVKLSNNIPLHAFPGICHALIGSTYQQRLRHPHIPDIRAEYMPLAAQLVMYVLSLADFKNLIHSAYSLKEGAMQEVVKRWKHDAR
ncbi:MAG: hypothetical protein ACKVOR_14275 [Flavobacteriales bacterium]